MNMPIAALGGLLGNFGNFSNPNFIRNFLITILVLCISLSFHEAAHAWAAYRLGDDTAALQGRLTLNPLAHLDPIGSLVFIIGGIGWARPVPINSARFDRKVSMKKGIVLTSLAGPMSNLVLAAASAVLFFLVQTVGALTGLAATNLILSLLDDLFLMMYSANVSLAVFNLLPVPPLDGYKVFGAALPGSLYYKLMDYERYIGLVFLLLVFFGRGILGSILSVIRWPFDQLILVPLQALFNWLWQILGLN
jgi:Zn-dependent protease